MRRLALLCVLALAACDDPQVTSAAVDLLEFGVVQAKVTCVGVMTPAGGLDDCQPLLSGSGTYVAHRLADGSGLVSVEQQFRLYGRSEAEAGTLSLTYPGYTPPAVWFVENGEVHVHRDGCTDVIVDIETECTGFNLEAFGVD